MTTPKAGLKTMPTGTLKNEQVFNEGVILLEALLYRGVVSRGVLDPSGISPSPSNGDIYLINDRSPTSTGDWSGQGGKIAVYSDGWRFLPPDEGLTLWIIDELQRVQYRSGRWTDMNDIPPQTLAELSDVDMSGSPSPQHGEMIRYDATLGKWVHGAVHTGARLSLASDFSIVNGSPTNTLIEWDTLDYDTNGYFNAANPGELVIPPGLAGKHVLRYGWSTDGESNAIWQMWISHGSTAFDQRIGYLPLLSTAAALPGGGTIVVEIDAVVGDRFLAMGFCTVNTNMDAGKSYFSIQKID